MKFIKSFVNKNIYKDIKLILMHFDIPFNNTRFIRLVQTNTLPSTN